jgi:hypothetical protein
LTRIGILGAPRKTPGRMGPIIASGLVILVALPLFLIAGWPLGGWAIAAVLWIGTQAFSLLLARLKPSPDNLAASGVLAFGMMFKLLAVMVVLIAIASSDARLGLAAVILYGLAYTVEFGLSLATYYGQEPTA